jgi:2,5-dihydroxypyridine 5,6-dioxygenase
MSFDTHRHLLERCGGLRAGERFVLISDPITEPLVPAFLRCARALGAVVDHVVIAEADRHGVEPGETAEACMLDADLVAAVTLKSIAHTRARRGLNAQGGRFLSLPGYTEAMLCDPAVRVDYRAQYPLVRAVTDLFSKGEQVRVRTAAGTDIRLSIAGRTGNCCPGFVDENYRLGSPPDIESNVSPIEEASEGVVVVDGSVACEEIGLLRTPIVLNISGGRITSFESDNPHYVSQCEAIFSRVGSPLAYVLAECGVGLNPEAKLTGNMLTDEGVLGCVHFGFGSNSTVGGLNDVPFHLDFVFRDASLWVDETLVLDGGRPIIGV